MIIVRSPLRITLGGGGTDLPSYYRGHGGFLMAAAIDRYVYITLHQTFVEDLIVKYSKTERVGSVEAIEHPIVREAFRLAGVDGRFLEMTSMADIPAGTGLGSSGSFTTGLIKALYTWTKRQLSPAELAELACKIEIDILGEPIGKQDQYAASYGGVTCFRYHPSNAVEAWPLPISRETLYNLEDNLMLFFTGFSRQASSILKEQDEKSRALDQSMIDNLHFVKELGERSLRAFETGELEEFGGIMHEHWLHKKQRSKSMSNPEIDNWYNLGMKNGAVGGKLVGAGGGGFLMFYAHDKTKLRHAMTEAGLKEVRFRFDFEGTKVVAQ